MKKMFLVVLGCVVSCGNMAGGGGGGASGGTGGGGSAGAGGGGAGGGGAGGSGGTGGAGGGGMTVPPDWVSGTRMRAVVVTTVDGGKAFSTWHDNQLNISCFFLRATDDVMRCIPLQAGITHGYFSDAGCSTPVLLIATTGNCGAPQYAYDYVSTVSCLAKPNGNYPSQYAMYSVGASVSSFYAGTPASCTQATIPPGYTYYAAGAVVPPSTFAAGDYVIE